jgi:hypothetical protein
MNKPLVYSRETNVLSTKYAKGDHPILNCLRIPFLPAMQEAIVLIVSPACQGIWN